MFRFKADGAAGSTPYEFRAVAAGTSTLARVVGDSASTSDWKLKFDDQFNGSGLDLSRWSYRKLGLREGSRMRSQSSKRVRRTSAAERCTCDVRKHLARKGYYLNGQISTQGKFAYTYGTSAARIKFAMRRGQHGGFWMQPRVPDRVLRLTVQDRRGDRRHRVLRQGLPGRRAGALPVLLPAPRRDQQVRQGVPRRRDRAARQDRQLVVALPRVLRGLDLQRLRLPHRRRHHLAHQPGASRSARST